MYIVFFFSKIKNLKKMKKASYVLDCFSLGIRGLNAKITFVKI